MHVYFSTVIRGAPLLRGGELVCLNWLTGKVEASVPIAATNPELKDPNPRGNTRGGRGIALIGDEVICASYHTLKVFDRRLRHRRDISHPLMVGLHEVFATERGTVWVSSTAVDAVLEIDIETGKCLREFWPRESLRFQEALGVGALEIDKSADNRGRYLEGVHLRSKSHLHLNAVTEQGGEVYGFFNRFGVIANLGREEILIRDEEIGRGHNLIVDADGHAFVNDTHGRNVVEFDLDRRARVRQISLLDDSGLQRRIARLDRAAQFRRRLHDKGWLRIRPPRPMFVRGLDRIDGNLFAGFSPASIARIDEKSGRVLDSFTYKKSVYHCVHGLRVSAASP